MTSPINRKRKLAPSSRAPVSRLSSPIAKRSASIANTGARIDCPADRRILHAAVGAGVDYPYVCVTGNCGACLSDLRSGEVSMLPYSDNALTAAQRAEGKVLACRARPCSDVEVIWLGRGRK